MKHFSDLSKPALRKSLHLWHCEAADAERYYGETVVQARDKDSALAAAMLMFPMGMLAVHKVEAEEHYLKMLNRTILPTPEEAYEKRL